MFDGQVLLSHYQHRDWFNFYSNWVFTASNIRVTKRWGVSRQTRWHIVYKWGSSLLSDKYTHDILGYLSAYKTLPVPLKYPSVCILILCTHSLCIQECYVKWPFVFFLHCLANWNTIGYVLCSNTISFLFGFKNNMPSSPHYITQYQSASRSAVRA